ncbi:unnamed protein product [Malus baccata var. baccata]
MARGAKDQRGELYCCSFWAFLPCSSSSPLHAEMLAARRAVEFINGLHRFSSNMVLEGDLRVVIAAVSRSEDDCSFLVPIIYDIR